MLRGSCLCGQVQFEVAGPYPRLYQCHCSLCRKQGGSTSNTGLIVAADKFRWALGEAAIEKWQRPTGFRSHFCRQCGAPVPNPLRDTGFVWVPSGLIDDPAPLEIAAQIHVASKASWARLAEGVPQYEAAPELRELIALLHGQEE